MLLLTYLCCRPAVVTFLDGVDATRLFVSSDGSSLTAVGYNLCWLIVHGIKFIRAQHCSVCYMQTTTNPVKGKKKTLYFIKTSKVALSKDSVDSLVQNQRSCIQTIPMLDQNRAWRN